MKQTKVPFNFLLPQFTLLDANPGSVLMNAKENVEMSTNCIAWAY